MIVTRNTSIPGARYFGPYPKVWAMRETVDLMLKAFPIRSCSDSSYKRASRPGGRASPGRSAGAAAPAPAEVTIEEHHAIVARLRRLHGRPGPADRRLT